MTVTLRQLAELVHGQACGDADLVRVKRDQAGALDVLVTDMKSTTRAKVEHRLQAAFYHLLLERLFERAAIGPATIKASTSDDSEAPRRKPCRQ